MNYRMIVNILGKVLLAEALLLLLPMSAALYYHESPLPFLYTILLLAVLSLAMIFLFKPTHDDLFAREGFLCTGLAWILMSAFGALPFVFSGDIPNYLNAFFETVSGFTTTGASILVNPEVMTRGCMFWRLFTHWIGGMGVLVLIAAVLPVSGNHYIHIMRAEVPGPTVSKLVPRARKTARILYIIYMVLTLLEIFFLLAGGLGFFDSVLHAFATAGTGGFSTRAASIAAFDSVYVEMVISVFMLLFGCNFNLFFLMLTGEILLALKSEEFRIYLCIVAAAVFAIAGNIAYQVGGFTTGLRYSFFQVATIISTTGFSTANFDNWPEFSRWILVLLMFIGGCAGSTGGGIKVSRIILLAKSYLTEIKKLVLPSRVKKVWFESRPVEAVTLRTVHVFFSLYIAIAFISVLILSLDGHDFTTNFTASVACISNVGPGLSGVGPACNYLFFSPLSKIVLIFEMLLGRLELFPMILLLTPSMWKSR